MVDCRLLQVFFLSLKTKIALTLRKVTLKSKITVLLFNTLTLFLFHYFLIKRRCYHEIFHIFVKASDRVSIAGLVVTGGCKTVSAFIKFE